MVASQAAAVFKFMTAHLVWFDNVCQIIEPEIKQQQHNGKKSKGDRPYRTKLNLRQPEIERVAKQCRELSIIALASKAYTAHIVHLFSLYKNLNVLSCFLDHCTPIMVSVVSYLRASGSILQYEKSSVFSAKQAVKNWRKDGGGSLGRRAADHGLRPTSSSARRAAQPRSNAPHI